MKPRAIVTGINGTVGPYVGREFAARGYDVSAWDRTVLPPEDDAGGRRFLDEVQPACFFHIGLGPPEWAATLAADCADRGIAFLNTSTVSVFADREAGPITPETVPDGTSDYARYKIDCEERVRAANPAAVIARIAWQIGPEPGTSNMLTYLQNSAAEHGVIEASTRWYPACTFLEDTAAVLVRLLENPVPGTYLVDGNEKLNFYEIASALNRLHNSQWTVIPVDGLVLDLRMTDGRIDTPRIEARLGLDG